MQYEVRFQNGIECGGAYIKLLTDTPDFSAESFADNTPYTIMFGPDKCGSTNKVQLPLAVTYICVCVLFREEESIVFLCSCRVTTSISSFVSPSCRFTSSFGTRTQCRRNGRRSIWRARPPSKRTASPTFTLSTSARTTPSTSTSTRRRYVEMSRE